MAHQGDNTMDSTDTHHIHTGKTGNYGRFFAMIGTSTIVMYGLMYLNTYALDHVFFSQTRMWMALYMGGMMAVIMLAFMLGMYSNRKTPTKMLLLNFSVYLRSTSQIGANTTCIENAS